MFRSLKINLAGIILMVTFLAPLGLTQKTAPKAPVKAAPNTGTEGNPATSTMVVPAGDWPMYGRDLTSSRYSPLAQITKANVSTLPKAWSYHPSAPAGDKEKGGGRGRGREAGVVGEATPIVVNGVMYLPSGSQVVARCRHGQ